MLEANLEDFLGAVLSVREGEWASADRLAEYLGVKPQSALMSIKKLSAMRLVRSIDRGSKVALTETGEELAKMVSHKHDLIKRFLMNLLCVRDEVAEEDAHNMEHTISEESLEKITSFLEFIEEDQEGFLKWFSNYKSFVCPVEIGK